MEKDSLEDPALDRRRQKGRLAQRAFRQRQVDTVERLEKKIEAFKSAIQAINKVSITLAHVELDRTVSQALKLVGLEPVKGAESVQTSLPNIDLVNYPHALTGEFANRYTATRTGFVEEGKIISPEPRLTLQPASRFSHFINPAGAEPDSWSPIRTDPVEENSLKLYHMPEKDRQAGRMSPRMTYGLWFEPDRFINVHYAPADILPYLGNGECTFAGTLYWRTVEMGRLILSEYQRRQLVSSSQNIQDSTALVEAIFGLCLELEQPRMLIRCISVKLELRKYERMDRYDHNVALRLRHLVPQELNQRGDHEKNYMSALEVAEYIRRLCAHGTLEGLDCTARNQDDRASKKLVDELVENLALRSVMFGDGPRYKVEAVDEMIRTSLPNFIARFMQSEF